MTAVPRNAPRAPLSPPHPSLRACVVVPARNEEDLVGSCLSALAEQDGVSREEYEVLLVIDHCTDATEERAREVSARYPGLRLFMLDGPGRGAGHARRTGMDEACRRLSSLGRLGGLIASTDADSVVARDWLCAQLAAAARGARAIGGRIELRDDAELLPRGVSGWRAEQGRLRQRELAEGPGSFAGGDDAARIEHWQFSGASLSLTAATYKEIGGLAPRAALEDEYLERTLAMRGVPIERPLAVRVATSARLLGRASRGLARDLALAAWVRNNTFDASGGFDLEDLLEKKRASGTTVSALLLPTREDGECRETASPLGSLGPLARAGLVDEAILLRSRTGDAPATTFANGTGVRVVRTADLMPGFGPVRGYGDALWRGLSAAGGEIVLVLDPSVPDPEGDRTLGLLGPLLTREGLRFVKGFSGEAAGDSGSSGLDELVARPLINLYSPELAGFVAPLSPELAADRALLASLPFPVGHGASLSLLLDAARAAGIHALAQARLPKNGSPVGVPLPDLSEAAHAILTAAAARAHGEEDLEERAPGPLFLPLDEGSAGFAQRRVAVEERPPLDSL